MTYKKDYLATYPGIQRLLCRIILLLFLCIGHKTVWAESETRFLTIAVASDIHLNPDNQYGVVTNPLVFYNMEIADALIYDAIHQNADILLLTGDNTDAGGNQSHQALIQKLRTAKTQGLRTYVLPGNHDLSAEGAEQFAKLYQEFGYADAYSRDSDSLSYSLIVDDYDSDTLMILMLDTDGYSRRTNGAYVSDITLEWIEEQLKQASEKKLDLLVAGHYPLLTEHVTDFTGKEALIALLREYQVPLYLCGHLHGRSVSYDKGLTELVVDQVTSYPCSYALINMEADHSLRYSPRKIDVSDWAHETKQQSPDLLNFEDYSENLFNERCEETVLLLKGEKYLFQSTTKKAIEFFKQVQKEYLLGTLSDHKKEIMKGSGYKAFMKIADGTTYGRWIPKHIESATPYTAGFYLKDHRIN